MVMVETPFQNKKKQKNKEKNFLLLGINKKRKGFTGLFFFELFSALSGEDTSLPAENSQGQGLGFRQVVGVIVDRISEALHGLSVPFAVLPEDKVAPRA
jgi:hypothetical protein